MPERVLTASAVFDTLGCWQTGAGLSFVSAVQIDGGNRLGQFQIAGQRRVEKRRRFENPQKPLFDPPMPTVRLIVGGLRLDEGLRQMRRGFDETQT